MWECDDCEAAVAGVGYRDAVHGLETHLARAPQREQGCRTGWYSYGHDWREKTTCRVTRLPDGSFAHEKLSA